MHNLLFIVESIPDKLFIKKNGLIFFKNKGIKVNILYIAGLCRASYYKKIKNKTDFKFFDGKNKVLIVNFIREKVTKDTIVFCNFRKNNKTIFINKILKSKNTKTAFISMESSLQNRKSFLEKLKILFFDPLLFLKLFLIKLNYYENFKLNYDYVFTAGKLSEINYKKNSDSKVFKIHHYDFDLFKNIKKKIKPKNYALFLSPASQNPDIYDKNPGRFNKNYLLWNNKNYLKNIKYFLKKISYYTKKQIIVAEHPKEEKDISKLLGFKSYKGLSAELIKNASFVVCFDTTAYQIAVLFRKPIIFLTSKNLPEAIIKDIKNRSLFFHKLPIKIENDFNYDYIKSNLHINKKIYKKYIKFYITNTSKSLYKYKSYELIYKYLKDEVY